MEIALNKIGIGFCGGDIRGVGGVVGGVGKVRP